MEQQPAYKTATNGNSPLVTGSACSAENFRQSYNVQTLQGAEGSVEHHESAIKKLAFDLLPPVTVGLVVLFWVFAPAPWVESSWSIVIAGLLTTAFVQCLELFRERHADWRINKRELLTDIFYLALGYTAIGWASTTFAEEPLKAIKQSLGITTDWAMHLPFLLQVALVILLVEFGQYWMHRLMHNNSFLWSTHAPHHHITQLNAMKGYVGNPLELFLISLSVVALFDLPPAAQFCAFNILGAVSTFAHANVRSDPPRWYSYVFTTIQHHSLHHTALSYEDTRCNYGNSLILLDRIFGTFRAGESAVVGQDDRERLSIWDQFTFPIRPWIEKVGEKQANTKSAIS